MAPRAHPRADDEDGNAARGAGEEPFRPELVLDDDEGGGAPEVEEPAEDRAEVDRSKACFDPGIAPAGDEIAAGRRVAGNDEAQGGVAGEKALERAARRGDFAVRGRVDPDPAIRAGPGSVEEPAFVEVRNPAAGPGRPTGA